MLPSPCAHCPLRCCLSQISGLSIAAIVSDHRPLKLARVLWRIILIRIRSPGRWCLAPIRTCMDRLITSCCAWQEGYQETDPRRRELADSAHVHSKSGESTAEQRREMIGLVPAQSASFTPSFTRLKQARVMMFVATSIAVSVFTVSTADSLTKILANIL